jgi:hypothetical protein
LIEPTLAETIDTVTGFLFEMENVGRPADEDDQEQNLFATRDAFKLVALRLNMTWSKRGRLALFKEAMAIKQEYLAMAIYEPFSLEAPDGY